MKKNAFTLIELLAVLVIIAIISSISIAIIANSVTESKNKLSEVQIKHLEESARTFATINTINFSNIFANMSGSNKCIAVEIEVLMAEGLISSNVVDPKDTQIELNGFVKITYDESNYQYVYEYIDAAISTSTCSYKYWVENNEVKHTS